VLFTNSVCVRVLICHHLPCRLVYCRYSQRPVCVFTTIGCLLGVYAYVSTFCVYDSYVECLRYVCVSNQATTNQCIRLKIVVCACVYVYVYVYVSVCVGVCVSVFVCGVHNHPHLPWGFVHKSMVERAL